MQPLRIERYRWWPGHLLLGDLTPVSKGVRVEPLFEFRRGTFGVHGQGFFRGLCSTGKGIFLHQLLYWLCCQRVLQPYN